MELTTRAQKYVLEIKVMINDWLETEEAKGVIKRLATAKSSSWIFSKRVIQRGNTACFLRLMRQSNQNPNLLRRLNIFYEAGKQTSELKFMQGLEESDYKQLKRWLLWEEYIEISEGTITMTVVKEKNNGDEIGLV